MTVLSHQAIKALCAGPAPIISDLEQRSIRSASYDLRVGSEYYLGTYDKRRLPFSNHFPTPIGLLDAGRHKLLVIGANEVVLVMSHEKVKMRANLVGHLSLKLDIMLSGLIMSNQSQIDACYEGPIYALLYNLSDGPVTLRHLQPFLRLEFATLDSDTERPYDGDFKSHFSLGDVVTARIRSSLSDMSEAVVATRRRVFAIAGGSLLAVVLGVGAILGPVQSQASNARTDVRGAEQRADAQADEVKRTQEEVAVLQAVVAQLSKELDEQRARDRARESAD